MPAHQDQPEERGPQGHGEGGDREATGRRLAGERDRDPRAAAAPALPDPLPRQGHRTAQDQPPVRDLGDEGPVHAAAARRRKAQRGDSAHQSDTDGVLQGALQRSHTRAGAQLPKHVRGSAVPGDGCCHDVRDHHQAALRGVRERFVNVWWGKVALVAAIKKWPRITTRDRRLAINELCARLRQIKTDLLHPRQEKAAESLYHAWIDVERWKVLPQRPLQKDNFHYDIQCSPQDYLRAMLYMLKAVEARGGTVYNVCPLRSSIIPKHFRLDTQSLIDSCLTKKQGKRRYFNADGNLVRRQAEIWGLFCRTDKRCFHMETKTGTHTVSTTRS